MKLPRLNSNQKGFTLVELLVALLVGGILIAAAITIMNNQTRLSQRGRDLVYSNAFAEAKIEAVRSAGFLSLNDGTTNITDELPDELNAPRDATLEVTSPNPAIKQVVLTISYNEQGSQRSETYTTYVGELGAGQN